MKYVKKIIFRNKETYNRFYQGSELLFEVQKEPVGLDYLTFTAIEPSRIKYEPSSVTTAQYSYDKVNWNYAYDITLSLNTGDKVYFKGNIAANQSNSKYAKFIITGKVAASGSIMSLQSGNPQDKTIKYHYEFYSLFENCSSLVTAPELPATTLAEECYCSMFSNCDSLTEAPKLPAKTLAPYCYHYMFFSCKSLVTAPELPTTELANYCYYDMFNGCTSLVTAPELPATTLAEGCYYNMFYNCTKLNYIKCAAIEYNSTSFKEWLENVAPTGDFYCYDSSIFPTGASGIPTGWTVHSEVEHKEYDALYVSGRYEFKIPKGDGRYYIIFSRNDCEADLITDKDFTSLNQTIISSTSKPDDNEWELFFNGSNLYFDICKILNKRLEWKFGTIKKDTVYTIGGSNGNYLGTDRAIYVNGSKKVYSKETSVWDNDSDIIKIGENVTNVYVGNIKIYESTGLMYNIVPIMYNGNVAFYDKVNKRFMEIVSTPPSEYAKTRLTGEIIELIY